MELFFNEDKVTIKNASMEDLANLMKFMNNSNKVPTNNVVHDAVESNTPVKSEDVVTKSTEEQETAVIDTSSNIISNKVDINKKVEILKLLETNHSKEFVEQLAKETNISISTLNFWINNYIKHKRPLKHNKKIIYKCKVPYKVAKQPYKRYSEELKKTVAEEAKKCTNYSELEQVSLKYGVSIASVYTWLDKYTKKSTIESDTTDTTDTTDNDTNIESDQNEVNNQIVNIDADNSSKLISYDDWRVKVIYPLIDRISPNRKVVLSKMYKQMNSVYGIVWEQLYKDFAKHYGTRANSTLRSIYFLEKEVPYGTYGNEHYENILENLLKDEIAKKNK